MAKWAAFFSAFALVLLGVGRAEAISYTTIDDPFGVKGTFATGVSGSTIVGYYYDADKLVHGFKYDGSTYTTLDDPAITSTSDYTGTYIRGISGDTLVGFGKGYTGIHDPHDHGFIYDGSTYTPVTVSEPGYGNEYTYATGISGDRVVGYYTPGPPEPAYQGFLYDGSTYTDISDPLAATLGGQSGTFAEGIWGDKIVGGYYDAQGEHGFVYDGSTYTTLDDPLVSPGGTAAYGISGDNIVGAYYGGTSLIHGFFFDGTTYTTILDPNSYEFGTYAVGVDGTTVVGYYYGSDHIYHGFVAVVPEPSTSFLAAFGFASLAATGWRRRRRRTA